MKYIFKNNECDLQELKDILHDNESMKEYYYDTEEFAEIYEEYGSDSEILEYDFVIENSYMWLAEKVYNELEKEIENAINDGYTGIKFLGQTIEFKC